MPLEILGPMVVVGIALVVLLVHFSGLSRQNKLASGQLAEDIYLANFPNARPESTFLSKDGGSALVKVSARRLGLVVAFGDRFVTRSVSIADLSLTPDRSKQSISLNLDDFTLPSADFQFESEADMNAVLDWLTPEQEN